jgi:hypothetical protein
MQISNLWLDYHCEALHWVSFRTGLGRNIQAINTTHKDSAKASAHLAYAKPIRAICRDIACLE